jgi:hypothetical protein
LQAILGDGMLSAKDLLIRVIEARTAIEFIKKNHYSGKVVNNSQLHLGVFIKNGLHGVMQFGPSLDKRKTIGLVKGTKWNEFIELNRMAFDNVLPKNSESRAISVAMKLLKKRAPHIKWVVSFADAAQCGDGTIYRASGFVLTGIGEGSIYKLKDGRRIQRVSITSSSIANKQALMAQQKHGLGLVGSFLKEYRGEQIKGYSLRYIYFINKTKLNDLTVPIIPFSKIKEVGASMYKGKSPAGEVVSRPAFQSGVGGSIPTVGHS